MKLEDKRKIKKEIVSLRLEINSLTIQKDRSKDRLRKLFIELEIAAKKNLIKGYEEWLLVV